MTNFGRDYGSCVRITVCSTQGGRKYMEDRINVHCERKPNGELEYIFLGVYDGHGGADASHYAREHLRSAITEHRSFDANDDEGVLRAIKDGFLQTHYEMWKKFEHWPKTASGYPSTSGTTASVAIIKNGKVYFGHVGDSAIVIGKKLEDSSVDGTMITIDHKPDDPIEMKRIEEMGGEVMSKSGIMRVVWTRPSRGHQGPVRRSTSIEKVPFLAVARALGDLWSYNSSLDTFVVSPEPDVGVIKLTSEHACLILGSDGLWNVIKAQNSIEIVNSHEWRESQDHSLHSVMQSNHARWLVRHALLRWGNLRADNISVVTALLDPPESCDDKIAGVVVENPFLDAESLFTEYPSAMIRVTPRRTQLAKTKPVELMYFGASDPTDKSLAMNIYGPRNGFTLWSYQHRNTALTHRGPGYCIYGEERTENWSILPTVFESYVVRPKFKRPSTPTAAVWDDDDAEDDNRVDDNENTVVHHVKKDKFCNNNNNAAARIMLVNNRPNVLESTKKIEPKSSNVQLIVTTPKRQYVVSSANDDVDYVNNNNVETTTNTPHNVKKRRSTTTTLIPVTCGYYNLRRCSRVTRSGAKLSPSPRNSSAITTATTGRHHHPKFRRYSLIATECLPTRRHLTFDRVSASASATSKSFPYRLRDRPRSSPRTATDSTKKRSAAISFTVRESTTTTSTTSVVDDDESFSASFTKRLKLFVESSSSPTATNRFRRE